MKQSLPFAPEGHAVSFRGSIGDWFRAADRLLVFASWLLVVRRPAGFPRARMPDPSTASSSRNTALMCPNPRGPGASNSAVQTCNTSVMIASLRSWRRRANIVFSRKRLRASETYAESRCGFAGYAISYRRGGRTRDGERDQHWHAHVEIERQRYLEIKAQFLQLAVRRSPHTLALAFYELPFEPYAPIRRQLLLLRRDVNRVRKQAGFGDIPIEVLPLRRRIVKPFGESADPNGRTIMPTEIDFGARNVVSNEHESSPGPE